MNTELLEKIAAHIEAHPEQLNMEDWISPCGTSACIAGWAMLLTETQPDPLPSLPGLVNGPYSAPAKRLLGLDDEQARRLFFTDEWPSQFWGEDRYGEPNEDGTPTTRQCVARIHHFVKTNGAE